jgi:hypothetical protein
MEQRGGESATRGLEPLPAGFAGTTAALHRVAEEIVAPARKPDNEIALRATPGGFGTPPFDFDGEERQVRVEADQLVYQVGGGEQRTRIGSLAEAGALVTDLLPDDIKPDDKPLEVNRSAAQALGAWYALGDAVLEELIAGADPDDDPSPVNLWPEHFDIAIELGPDGEGGRANYGFSPGDENHAEPYLYVGPWTAEVEGELWNAPDFAGAELGYAELLAAEDPRRTAIEFCRTRKQALKEGMNG